MLLVHSDVAQTSSNSATNASASSSSSHQHHTPLHLRVRLTPKRVVRVAITFDRVGGGQVQMRLAANDRTAATTTTPAQLYHDATSSTYHLSHTKPSSSWVPVHELPNEQTTCHVHVVDIETTERTTFDRRRARYTDVGEVVALVGANGATTLVNRSTQVLCARFRQRRYIDPLKTICLPADVWAAHRHTIQVTLTGMLQYDKESATTDTREASKKVAKTATRKRDRVRGAVRRQNELLGATVRRSKRRRVGGGVQVPKKKKGLDPKQVMAGDVEHATHTATLDACVKQSWVQVERVDTEADTDDSGLYTLHTQQPRKRRSSDESTTTVVDPSAVVRVVLHRHFCGSWALTFPTASVAAQVHALNLARQSRVAVRVEAQDAVNSSSSGSSTESSSPSTSFATHTTPERTFPASQLTRPTPTTVLAYLNDDEFFRCPMCAQALPGLVGGDTHHDRVFRYAARSEYGNVVGLKSQEKSIKLDPHWLYVTTFKKFNPSALRPATYAANWGANHSADKAQQYRLPLGDKPQVHSTNVKKFGCTVVKANVRDVYDLQSFDLHTFFEQQTTTASSDTADLSHVNAFVVSGVEHSNLNTSLQRPKATLSQMLACVLGESTYHRGLTTAWLHRALTPARVLHVGDGAVVRYHGDYTANDTDTAPSHLPPIIAARVQRTTRYLLDTFHTDTALTGDFHTWWELFTFIGYPKFKMQLHYFFFDVRQTVDATNFVPRLMCPPLALERYYWNPYTPPPTQGEPPLLFFTVSLKIQCRRTFTDAFYLLKRMRKTTEGAEYVYPCLRARVRHFCDTPPASVTDAVRTFTRTLRTLPAQSGETLEMCVNAYYYWKLFQQVQRCKRQVWTLRSSTTVPSPTVKNNIATCDAPPACTFQHEYLIDPHTLRITHRCYRHRQHKLFALPVDSLVNHLTVAQPSYATPDAPHVPYVSLETAHKLLRHVRNGNTTPVTYQLDALGRVVAIVTGSAPNDRVPVHPVLAYKVRDYLGKDAPRTFAVVAPSRWHAAHPTPRTSSPRAPDQWAQWQAVLEAAARTLRRTSGAPTAHRVKTVLHEATQDAPTWVRQMVERYVVQPTHSTVRTAVATGQVGALRRYVNDRAQHAYRQNVPMYSFPEPHTQAVFQSVYRQPADTLFAALLQKTDQDKRDEAAHGAHSTSDTSRLLPEPWRSAVPNTRVLTGDAFYTLAQSNSMQATYVKATRDTPLVPEHVVCQHLRRQPVYVLNEQRVLLPQTDKALDVQHALVVLTRPVAQSCTVWAQMAHPSKVYVPHVPDVLLQLHKTLSAQPTTSKPALTRGQPHTRVQPRTRVHPLTRVQLLVRHPQQRHVVTHHELTRIQTDANGHTHVHLRPPLDWRKASHADGAKVHTRVANHPTRFFPCELQLDTQFHTVHHYELLKTRVKHKMKNLLVGQLSDSVMTQPAAATTKGSRSGYPLRYVYSGKRTA